MQSWSTRPPPIPSGAALKEYHYLTQNLAGAQKFDNDEALLTYIQGRLTMLEMRAVDSGTQPQADPVWSWQRIKQDVLAFVKGGCNGNGILAAQPLFSEQPIQYLVQGLFPAVTDQQTLAQLPSRYPSLHNLLMREIYKVMLRPSLALAPGAAIHLLPTALRVMPGCLAIAGQEHRAGGVADASGKQRDKSRRAELV